MKPLDERLRNLRYIRPPALFMFLDRYADEVTSLLIERDGLREQNIELVDAANARYWDPTIPPDLEQQGDNYITESTNETDN